MRTENSLRARAYGAVVAAALVPVLISGMATAALAVDSDSSTLVAPETVSARQTPVEGAPATPAEAEAVVVVAEPLAPADETPVAETPIVEAPAEEVRDGGEAAPGLVGDTAVTASPERPEPSFAPTGDPGDPKPTVTITLPEINYVWYGETIEVFIKASSSLGTIDSLSWKTTGAQPGKGSVAAGGTTITISAHGTTKIEAWATDSEGYGSDVVSRTAKLDLTAPLIEVLAPVAGVYRVGDTITPDAACSDPESGITQDGSTWCTVFIQNGSTTQSFQLGKPYTFKTTGDYILGGRVYNGANTRTDVTLGSLRVIEDEDVAPTIVVSAPTLPASGWHAEPFTARFTGEDAGAGVRAVEYRLPTSQTEWGPWQSVAGDTATLPIATDGANKVQYRAVDYFDNVSEIEEIWFPLDASGPSITIARPADAIIVDKGDDLTLSYSCVDMLSGVASCDGTVDSGDALDTNQAGTFDYSVIAFDKAGNRTEITRSYTVVVPDVTAPTTSVGEPGTVPASGWFTGDTVFRMLADDNVGVASMSWTADMPNGQTSGNTSASSNIGFMMTVEGATTFRFSAVDAAGNRSAEQTFVLRIDKTDPTIKVTSPAVVPGLVEAVTEFTEGDVVDLDFECADAQYSSGIASCVSSVGDRLPTDVVGDHIATITATDVAGRETVEEISYTVVAGPTTEPGPGTGGGGTSTPSGVGGLASTGFNVTMPIVAGGVLLVAGVLALLVGAVMRRRA